MFTRCSLLSMAVLAAVATAVVFAEGPDEQPPLMRGPGAVMRRGPATRPRERLLSKDQERELLAALKEGNPVLYNRLMSLRGRNHRRYRWAAREMWRWYQRWKNMPPEVRDAVIAEQNERIRALKYHREIRRAENDAEKASLTAELREAVVRHFQCERKVHEHRLARLEEHIRRLRAKLAERDRHSDRIVQERMDRWLKAATQPADSPDRHRPTSRPAE